MPAADVVQVVPTCRSSDWVFAMSVQLGRDRFILKNAMTIEQVIATGLEHHRAGRLEEAETIYRQALTRQPNHHDALQLLGTLAYQRGAHMLAAECLTRAIAANPNVAHYHNNLGSALIELDRSEAAIAAYQRALALNPAFQDA